MFRNYITLYLTASVLALLGTASASNAQLALTEEAEVPAPATSILVGSHSGSGGVLG